MEQKNIQDYTINLNNFSIESKIGYGVYSKVYLITNNNDPNEKYAAKVIKKEKLDNDPEESTKSFFSEIMGLFTANNNPAILPLKGFSFLNFKKNLVQLLLQNMLQIFLLINF